jgi:hypothetical protein
MYSVGGGGGTRPTRAHARSERSDAAVCLSCSGLVMFRLMSFIALLCLLVSGSFLIFANEPLWTRILTFVAIGIIPSLISYESGWLLYWIFQAVGAAHDPVAARALVLGGMLAKGAQRGWRLTARFLNIAIEAMKPVVRGLEIVGDWQLCGARVTYRIVRSTCVWVAACIHAFTDRVVESGIQAGAVLRHVASRTLNFVSLSRCGTGQSQAPLRELV